MDTQTVSASATATESDLLARNPDGSMAQIPSDLANGISHDLGDLLALLQAARFALSDENQITNGGFHSRESRISGLLSIAEGRLLGTLDELSPYV